MTDQQMDALNAVAQLEGRLVAPGSPYEIATLSRDGVAYRVYRHAPRSLNDLYRKARQMGSATLAVFGKRRVSYEDAFTEAALLAAVLRNRFAVSPGVRVALVLEGRPEWLVAFFAVTSLGATAVLIDAQRTAAILHSLKLAGCKLAIMEHRIARAVSRSLNGIGHLITVGGDEADVALQSGQLSRWDELLREAQRTMTPAAQGSEAAQSMQMSCEARGAEAGEAVVAFTSGTTGPPKGAILTHQGILTGLMNMALGGLLASAVSPGHTVRKISARQRPRGAPCALVLAPLAYIGGYTQLLLALTVGGKLVLQEQWDAEEICRLIDREQVRSLAGATTAQIRELMRHRADAGSLTSIGIHGIALHGTLLDDIAAQWPTVTLGSGYGMTETNGSVAAISGETLRRYPQWAGRVLPTVEVRIVGPDGLDAEPGEVGEVWLRGASLMRGYCTEAGSVTGLADGWFRTGDLGSLSPHHFLSIADRADQVIETGNRRISALELERAVACDAGVAEAAVLWELTGESGGGHQEQEGLSVVVVVVMKSGATLNVDGIHRIVVERGSIAASAVVVVEASTLPKNRSGKVHRGELRAMLARRPENLKGIGREALL